MQRTGQCQGRLGGAAVEEEEDRRYRGDACGYDGNCDQR